MIYARAFVSMFALTLAAAMGGTFQADSASGAVNDDGDAARRRGDFYLGAGLAGSLALDWRDTSTSEIGAGAGLWLGYRRHFSRRFGLRAGVVASLGPVWVRRYLADSLDPDPGAHGPDLRGQGGFNGHLDGQLQALIGPFGHFVVEPGIAYGVGWHARENIRTHGRAGEGRYFFRTPYASAGLVVGVSRYFGRSDQYAATGMYTLDESQGENRARYSFGLGFTAAFRG